MRGIILAGGSGTRLNPIILGTSKQLVSVYDKPMIYYLLSTFMLTGIQDVPVVTTPHDAPLFHRLLGDGSQLGINLSYTVQQEPSGLARAFVLSAGFIDDDSAAPVLGDNTFYGPSMGTQLRRHIGPDGGVVCAYQIADPTVYGVVEFGESLKTISVEEEPVQLHSNYAVSGLYFYSSNVVEIAKSLQPSAHGEYEITDVNHAYLGAGRLTVEVLPRDAAWPDIGTFGSLTDTTSLICTARHRQNLNIGAPEEVVQCMGFIDDEGLCQCVGPLVKSRYGTYLLGLLDNRQS